MDGQDNHSEDKFFVSWNGIEIGSGKLQFELPDRPSYLDDIRSLLGPTKTITFNPAAAWIRRWPMLFLAKTTWGNRSEGKATCWLFPKRRWCWFPWLTIKLARYHRLTRPTGIQSTTQELHFLWFVEEVIYTGDWEDFTEILLPGSYWGRLRFIWSKVRERWDEWSFEKRQI